MKKTTFLIIAVSLVFSASPAFAQGLKLEPDRSPHSKIPNENNLINDFKSDVVSINQALTTSEFDSGEGSKALEREKDRVVAELLNSAAKVESMATRVEEINRHFTALRSAGVSQDDADQLDAFCGKNGLTDLSYAGQEKFIEEAYEAEAVAFDRLKAKLKPVADEMFTTNSGWKLAEVPLPSGYDPESESAREYVASQQEAQTRAHTSKMRAHQRIDDAATRAGWAAFRVRQMKAKTLEALRTARKPGSELEAQQLAAANPQSSCRIAVSVLRERQQLSRGTHGHGHAPATVATPGR